MGFLWRSSRISEEQNRFSTSVHTGPNNLAFELFSGFERLKWFVVTTNINVNFSTFSPILHLQTVLVVFHDLCLLKPLVTRAK